MGPILALKTDKFQRRSKKWASGSRKPTGKLRTFIKPNPRN